MICPPCAQAADTEPSFGHIPETCRDNGKQIRDCACQHRPATGERDQTGPATDIDRAHINGTREAP